MGDRDGRAPDVDDVDGDDNLSDKDVDAVVVATLVCAGLLVVVLAVWWWKRRSVARADRNALARVQSRYEPLAAVQSGAAIDDENFVVWGEEDW